MMQLNRQITISLKLMILTAGFTVGVTGALAAAPAGYVKSTIPFDAPSGLAFGPDGVLYVIEQPADDNWAMLQTILPDGSHGDALPVHVDDPGNFVFTGMAVHPEVGVLIVDNTGDGKLYAVIDDICQTLVAGLEGIADVAVRSSGEIFVSTAPRDGVGAVLEVGLDGTTRTVVDGLHYGAGLAFDAAGDLIVQDATVDPYLGRLQRVPLTETGSGQLEFGTPEPLLELMQSGYDLAIDSEGDLFTTGSGGLFHVAGSPLAETAFDTNGNLYQFAAGLAFAPGLHPFEPFAGPDGGRLVYIADWGDTFVTLLTPAVPGDYNGDGQVDDGDFDLWKSTFGSTEDLAADGNGDGIVDAADYTVWRDYLGTASGFGAGAGGAPLSVPEPAGVILLGSALVPLFLWRRRRQPPNAAG
jgi:hypothetical protein